MIALKHLHVIAFASSDPADFPLFGVAAFFEGELVLVSRVAAPVSHTTELMGRRTWASHSDALKWCKELANAIEYDATPYFALEVLS